MTSKRWMLALALGGALTSSGCTTRCEETVTTTETVTTLSAGGELVVPVGEGPLSGIWDTTWSAGSAVLTLSQHGDHVAGWYTNPQPIAPGAIAATITGSVMEGRWTDHLSSGLFRFEIGPDGRSFSGSWTNLDGSGGGAWSGVRR